jgi:hypothetical protein
MVECKWTDAQDNIMHHCSDVLFVRLYFKRLIVRGAVIRQITETLHIQTLNPI